jgi:hypothetical protein
MLGYEIDFGNSECLRLLSSGRLPDKLSGYSALSLMFKNDDENMDRCANIIRSDINSYDHYIQIISIQTVANLGGTTLC